MNGWSQAVHLPVAFRFDAEEVFIRQDPETGDVILSRKPESLERFFAALDGTDVPANFQDPADRDQGVQNRDPFEGWTECPGMLDTNMASCLVRKNPVAVQRAGDAPIASLCIPSITEGGLLFGLAKRPEATRLHAAVREFLRCVDVMK
jgi:antitoxin VapB